MFEDGQEDSLINPTVVFEIRSPSTELYDRTTKFTNYIRIPSLTDVLLAAQHEPHGEHFTRVQDDWVLKVVSGLEGAVELPSIGCRLPMAEVYRRVVQARRRGCPAPELDAPPHHELGARHRRAGPAELNRSGLALEVLQRDRDE